MPKIHERQKAEPIDDKTQAQLDAARVRLDDARATHAKALELHAPARERLQKRAKAEAERREKEGTR